ncbi:MAG TPA: hypothetical protein VKA84_10755 [Gemmatimonadaceae bacterium]|nr:hypothetical protein [Gemmatimonadaceae bacterium]
MGLREFRDSRGVSWKVWDVTPEAIHPVTAAEEFLAEYRDGWLCFESEEDRRRLPLYPKGWSELTDEELEKLLTTAQPLPKRRRTGMTPTTPHTPAPGAPVVRRDDTTKG